MPPTPRALITTRATAVSLSFILILSACSSGSSFADEPNAAGLLSDSSSPVDLAAPGAPDPLPVAAAEEQPGGGILWNQAVEHAGTTQRVCGPLAGGGNSEDDVFLNLGRDYPDPERFQIVVWDIGSLESIDGGVTLCTSGPITLYDGVAQIELTDPTLIEIHN
jgi:hypothetical protein